MIDDKYENLSPDDDIYDQGLYDDGGHVRPEALADMIDRAKDEMEDKILEQANLNAYYDESKLLEIDPKSLEEELERMVQNDEKKLKVDCKCDDMDDDSDTDKDHEYHGNTPIGYPSDGPEWFGQSGTRY